MGNSKSTQDEIRKNSGIDEILTQPQKPISLSSNLPSRNSSNSSPARNSSNSQRFLDPYVVKNSAGRLELETIPKSVQTSNSKVNFSLFYSPSRPGAGEPQRALYRTEIIGKSGTKETGFVSLERFDNFIPPPPGKTKPFVILADDAYSAQQIRKTLGVKSTSLQNRNTQPIKIVQHKDKYIIFGSIDGK